MTTTIIPARERAQAPIGLPYIAPLFWNKWFRWDGSPASGHYQLGGRRGTSTTPACRFSRTVSGTPS